MSGFNKLVDSKGNTLADKLFEVLEEIREELRDIKILLKETKSESIYHIGSTQYEIEKWQRKYPNKTLPPYPKEPIMGDMMLELRECKKCGKLFYTAEFSRWNCGCK